MPAAIRSGSEGLGSRWGEPGDAVSPAGDAAAIARILEEIMADPVGQLRVKGTAQASVDDNVERFLELYEQMILAGSPR